MFLELPETSDFDDETFMVTPSAEERNHGHIFVRGERMLVRAVLDRAVRDLFSKDWWIRDSAIAWFTDRSSKSSEGLSFSYVKEELDLNEKQVNWIFEKINHVNQLMSEGQTDRA